MITRTRIIGALVAPALLLPLLVDSAFGAATITVGTCAKQIEIKALDAQNKIYKAFQGCDTAYRKDKGPGYSVAAPACQKLLDKAIGLGNSSAMDKDKIALDALVGKTCNDTALLQLGHLPTGKFGDLWSRYVVMMALQKSYEQAIVNARDTVTMFQNMGGGPSGTTGGATGCPTCKLLDTAPCYEHACNYTSSGFSAFDDNSDQLNHVPGDLIGSAAFSLCQFGNINPPNEYIVGGGNSKGTAPIDIGGFAFACSLTIGDEGYISCGGSHPTVNYSSCQDSYGTTTPPAAGAAQDAGGCQAAITPDVCAPATPETVADTKQTAKVNGGACVAYHLGSATSGASFIILTNQLNTVLNVSAQLGPDGLPCTNDDAGTIAAPGNIGLTTGTADTQMINSDVAPTVLTNSDSGSPFTCGTGNRVIQSSNLSGGLIAGAFPTVSQPTTHDNAVRFHIGCQ